MDESWVCVYVLRMWVYFLTHFAAEAGELDWSIESLDVWDSGGMSNI